MKKFVPYGTIVMICVFMLIVGVIPMKATKINQRKLLVLGDAIASEYGLTNDEGYITEDVSWASLLAQKYVAELCDCAVDDYTTSDLLADVKKPSRQEMITSSDVICISIGGNNFVQLFYGNVDESVTKAGIDTAVATMIEVAAEDIDEIFTIIKEKNPEALVMVQTLYNPFIYCETSASQYVDGYQGTVGELVEEYIDNYNKMLKQKTQEHGFTCVEVAQKFQMEGKASWMNTKTDSLDLVFNGLNRIEGASASITGVTVTPSTNGASFRVKTNTDSQGQKYKAIENITQSGWAKLKVSATGSRYFWQTSAGLSPNASYTVTLNVECEGKEAEPVFYEESNAGNAFVIRPPRSKISFVVETDRYGAFTKEWDTIYVNSGLSTSIEFTDVMLTKNIDLELQPSEEGHYAIYEAYLDAGMDAELRDKLGILMDISGYRSGDTYTYPSMEGYVFAGWYQDAQFNKPISSSETTGNAYAKFVDHEVLGVKYQITADTLESSEKTDLRILTTVDSLQYHSVGFEMELENYGKKTYLTDTVYETIYGFADSQQVSYQPTVFSPISEYFMSYMIQGVTGDFFATEFSITPVWTTLDGTTVFGASRDFAVHDELSKVRIVNVNYKDEILLTEYFEEEDSFANAKLYSPTGKQITLGDGTLYADTMGTYTLVLPESVYTYQFVVKDIEGPVVMLNNQKTVVHQGETAIIQPRIVDNVDGEMDIKLDDLIYTVKKDGQAIIVRNHSFIAEELGEYIIEFPLKDTAGNQAVPVKIQCVASESVCKSVYGPGVTIVPVATNASFDVLQKEVTEGKDVGKTYTGLANITAGYSSLMISGSREAGLKANTEYQVIVDVALDEPYPGYYDERNGNTFIIGAPSGQIVFKITTDENGVFQKLYNNVIYVGGGTYVDFTGITILEIKESVYGEGVTVTPSGLFFNATEKVIEEGKNAGKTYTAITGITSSGWSSLTIAATADAGLKANTEYQVAVDVTLDAVFPGYYDERNGNTFIIGAPGGTIRFAIVTDENGAFIKSYNNVIYLGGGTYVDFTGITITEVLGSVYGKGVTVTPTSSFFTVTEKKIAEGENAGKTYTGITGIANSGWSSLTIVATKEAGLKANTEYEVKVNVVTDAAFPGYFDERNGNTFIIGAPGGTIGFTITTDTNGAFTKSYNNVIYTAGCGYIDFTGIVITEK